MQKIRSLRIAVHQQLAPEAWPHRGLSPVNRWVITAILASSLIAILRTEITLQDYFPVFDLLEIGFGLVFLVEFLLRLWSVVEDPRYADGWVGRMRYITSPSALIDLIVVVGTLAPTIAADVLALRLLRLFGMLRLARLGRISQALRHLRQALSARRYELGLTATAAIGVMLVGASALWLIEGDIQPEKFGSIPRAMWWAVVTLTTIGYGDVYPVTPLGKVIAGLTAIAGIGLIALPTGILASAFSEAVRRDRS